MSTKSFSFYWHGHRRGSLTFTVIYDPETNYTKYDCISTSHLDYLQSISKEHVPSYKDVSTIGDPYQPYTVGEVICAIFKDNEAILDSYERKYCCFPENEDITKLQNDLIEFAFTEFEWINESIL